MPIILENQKVKAGISYQSGALDIVFEDDPSFVRSETVLVDLMQRNIGLIFQSGYHDLGRLPQNLMSEDAASLAKARLRGHGEGGRAIELHAPVRIVGKNAALGENHGIFRNKIG